MILTIERGEPDITPFSPFLRLNLEAQNMCLYNLLNSPLTFAASQVICFHRLHTNMFSPTTT